MTYLSVGKSVYTGLKSAYKAALPEIKNSTKNLYKATKTAYNSAKPEILEAGHNLNSAYQNAKPGLTQASAKVKETAANAYNNLTQITKEYLEKNPNIKRTITSFSEWGSEMITKTIEKFNGSKYTIKYKDQIAGFTRNINKKNIAEFLHNAKNDAQRLFRS